MAGLVLLGVAHVPVAVQQLVRVYNPGRVPTSVREPEPVQDCSRGRAPTSAPAQVRVLDRAPRRCHLAAPVLDLARESVPARELVRDRALRADRARGPELGPDDLVSPSNRLACPVWDKEPQAQTAWRIARNQCKTVSPA